MNSIFLSFLLAASPAVSATAAISQATPSGACDAISVPATEEPYFSIWVNTITGQWECSTDRDRAKASALARAHLRYWSNDENILRGCRELQTTNAKGYYAVVRAATSDGYRFYQVFGAKSSDEALRRVTEIARLCGSANPEIVTVGSL